MDSLDPLVAARRKVVNDPTMPEGSADKWGLALSGGGIRSATFALGLVSALAKKKMLLRFDLMSTVSGGGYAGATIGRLFDHARRKAAEAVEAARNSPPTAVQNPASSTATASAHDAASAAGRAVQEGLGRDESTWTTWWLRANGRYLLPSGLLDLTFVIALYVRNVLAVHFELALLALIGGVLLACVNICLWSMLAWGGWVGGDTFFEAMRWLSPWLPVSWLALAGLAVLGAVQTSAFWSFPYVRRRGESRRAYAVVSISIAIVAALHPLFDTDPGKLGSIVRQGLWVSMIVLMACWLLGARYAQVIWNKAMARLKDDTSAAAEVRSVLTQRLSNTFRWGMTFLGLGVVERFAWHLAFEPSGVDIAVVGGFLAIIAPALRAALPYASRLTESTSGVRALMLAARVLGYLVMALLTAFWISLAYRAVLGTYFERNGLAFWPALVVALLLLLPMAAYLTITGRNLEFLNLSSLHAFYRARLVRSYLGAANERRFKTDRPLDQGTLTPVPRDLPFGKIVSEVEEVHLDDDVPIHDYRPMDAGGPIHLINMCVNQTNDPRGGVFNQDRQGLPLTVIAGGYMRAGAERWSALRTEEPLSLGTFVAISGAAIAPAAGAFTRGGISALAMFAGLRLGYWWSHERRKGESRGSVQAWTGKSRRILNELRGRFQGTQGPDWFLTDGGHFENTGAYALLAERCRVIVVSDAGADPRYAFGDLENLVRKARIDLNADIRFMRPRNPPDLRLSAPVAHLEQFGTIDDLASSQSNACMALATIIYAEDPLHPGVLVYVKPNFFVGLPVDLVNFKAANPCFPQEPTSDQSFSEAQWESYYLLGQEMGKALSVDLLTCIADAPDAYFVQDTDTTLDKALKRDKTAAAGTAPATPMQAISRIPARIAVSTVKATVGLTAVAAIGASVWQGVDAWRTARANGIDNERTALASLATLWLDSQGARADDESQRMRAPDDPRRIYAVSKLAATLLYTADRLCAHGQADWFLQPGLAREIALDALAECDTVGAGASKSCSLLLQSVGNPTSRTVNACLGPLRETPSPRYETYWAYDYTTKEPSYLLHPCDIYRVDASLRALSEPNAMPVDFPAQGCRRGDMPFDMPGADAVRSAMATLKKSWQQLELTSMLGWIKALPMSADGGLVGPGLDFVTPRPVPMPTGSGDQGTMAPSRTVIVDPAASAACRDVTVFIQVYDKTSYDSAEQLRAPWRALDARVPSIDNVQEAAKIRGRKPPTPVTEPTVRYHRSDAATCAGYLWPTANQILTVPSPVTPRLLSARFPSAPLTIEVWLPPNTVIGPRTVAQTAPR